MEADYSLVEVYDLPLVGMVTEVADYQKMAHVNVVHQPEISIVE